MLLDPKTAAEATMRSEFSSPFIHFTNFCLSPLSVFGSRGLTCHLALFETSVLQKSDRSWPSVSALASATSAKAARLALPAGAAQPPSEKLPRGRALHAAYRNEGEPTCTAPPKGPSLSFEIAGLRVWLLDWLIRWLVGSETNSLLWTQTQKEGEGEGEGDREGEGEGEGESPVLVPR